MKRILSILLAITILICCFTTATAIEAIDPGRTGSITVLSSNSSSIGTELTIYQVANVVVDGADQKYVLTDDFSDSGVDLTKLDNAKALAESLFQYVEDKSLSGTSKSVEDDGSVKFDNLKLGLYLIVQKVTQPGESLINPFLASVPMLDSDECWNYDVDASPKAQTYTLVDITVKVVWDDGDSYEMRPESVNISLYENSFLLDTVSLKESTKWSYTWKNLQESGGYTVVAGSLPGYETSCSQNDYTFTITYIYTGNNSSTPVSSQSVFSLFSDITTSNTLDITQAGSINIEGYPANRDEKISGAAFHLYKVADVLDDYSLQTSDDFADTKLDFNDIFDTDGSFLSGKTAETVEILTAYAEKVLPLDTKTTDEYGNLSFENLDLGLYFITIEDVSDSNETIWHGVNFLAMIPQMTINSDTDTPIYTYDVTVRAKAGSDTMLYIPILKTISNADNTDEIFYFNIENENGDVLDTAFTIGAGEAYLEIEKPEAECTLEYLITEQDGRNGNWTYDSTRWRLTVQFIVENEIMVGKIVKLAKDSKIVDSGTSITFENSYNGLLPQSGGNGTAIFYISGVLLIALAGIAVRKRKLS